MKLSIRPKEPEVEPAGTGYYIIRGTKCGRDKNGSFHCRCGFCRPITGDIFDYGTERYLKVDTERDQFVGMMMAYAENALRPGADPADQTQLATVLERLQQMTRTDWSMR